MIFSQQENFQFHKLNLYFFYKKRNGGKNMLKSEFEKLAGYSVSSEDYYDILEPIYMATDLDKKSFVDAVSRKRLEKKRRKNLPKL